LDGHSDADVLIHSLIDALLGAAGEGDIGQHFPDNDEQYKDISSLKLLKNTYEILKRNKLTINNIDVSVVLEEPRIAPFIMSMKNNIAQVLKVSSEKVNIKATTNEKMGFIGRGEGIVSYCVVSLDDCTG
jgi:2-C-methyl-D-erythritol 2,4-cyclodiphosphate synthase